MSKICLPVPPDNPTPIEFTLAGYNVYYTPYIFASRYNKQQHVLSFFDNVIAKHIISDLRVKYLDELKKRGVL